MYICILKERDAYPYIVQVVYESPPNVCIAAKSHLPPTTRPFLFSESDIFLLQIKAHRCIFSIFIYPLLFLGVAYDPPSLHLTKEFWLLLTPHQPLLVFVIISFHGIFILASVTHPSAYTLSR